jgi:hypothetical protein
MTTNKIRVLVLFNIFFLIKSTFVLANVSECSIGAKSCVFIGSLETHTYPGEPNYKDIKKGDEAETHLYIKLDSPMIVHFKDWDKNQAPTTEKLSLFQIGGDFDEKLFKVARSTNHFTINGDLFESFSGHHHTHFLVDPIKIIREKE